MTALRQYLNIDKLLKLIGIGIFSMGVFAFWVGPLEIWTYYAFTSSGKFHFNGFEFGSLMFGIITVQVLGYYIIALLGLSLGYGHLARRRWIPKLTSTLLWDWIALGLPLSTIAVLLLLSSKNLPPTSLPFLGFVFALVYPIAPLLMIKFYNSHSVQQFYKGQTDHDTWIEHMPQPILVSGSLMIFFVIVLHIPLLFNGIFPVLGRYSSGLEGVQLIDLSILMLIFLSWGVFAKKFWAWLGSIIYFSFLIISSTVTFLINSPEEFLSLMKFAPMEKEIFRRMPIQGYHFVFFFVMPLLITLVIIFASKQHFERKPNL
jgi:hypothetical protein